MLTIERDKTSNYSTTYETIFSDALLLFEQMFRKKEVKANIFKMTIYQGALLSLQHMEGDNIYEPKQALYARRVKQLKTKNKHLKQTINLDTMTKQLEYEFNNIKNTADTLHELDKPIIETHYEKIDRMKANYKKHTFLSQLEIREEFLIVNRNEQAKERNRLQW